MSSPLLLALRDPSCSVARLKFFLENGANADADLGMVLQTAAERGPEYVACVLSFRPNLPKVRGQEALRVLLKDRSARATVRRTTARIFLEHGIDLVPEDKEDTDLFFAAIELDCYDLVEKLLKWGAGVGKQVGGMTALHVAVQHACKGIISLLLANGAEVNSRTASGETPLSLAIARITPALKDLMTSGSETPNLQNRLKEAVDQISRAPPDTVEIVRALIEAGADVSVPNKAGRTPIMTASWYCRGEVMEELWRHGARMNRDSDMVRRDFSNAIFMGALSAVEFYLKNGVVMEGGMKEAMDQALLKGNQSMVQFFMEFDDPCSRTFESGYVLVKTLSRRTTLTFVKDVLEYGYTSLGPIFAVLKKDYYRNLFGSSHLAEAKVIMQRHVSAIIAAELSVNEHAPTHESVAKFLADSSFSSDSFKREVRSMKDMKIGDSDVTFHDVLNSPLSTVVRLLQNDSIVEVLKRGGFGEDFPSYTSMITKQFRKALFRKTLAEGGGGVKMLGALCAHLPKLPQEVIENIVGYLTNQTLYVLTNVCPLPPDEIVTTQSQE